MIILQSLLFQFEPVHKCVDGLAMKISENITLAIHYLAEIYITSLLETNSSWAVFFACSFGGLFITVVFTVGHVTQWKS